MDSEKVHKVKFEQYESIESEVTFCRSKLEETLKAQKRSTVS